MPFHLQPDLLELCSTGLALPLCAHTWEDGSTGHGGGRGRHSGPRKGEDVAHPLKVTLEDLYKGNTKKLSLSKNVLCAQCKGMGSKSGNSGRCGNCQGTGMKVTIRQIGPGMMQQMQSVCPECRGTGQMIKESDKCPQCRGNKVIQEKKILEVNIEKGMVHGQKITFQGEADEAVRSSIYPPTSLSSFHVAPHVIQLD